MTNEELVLNMLAELSATSITKAKNPQTLDENKVCAKEGGDVARVARENLNQRQGVRSCHLFPQEGSLRLNSLWKR